MDAPHAGPIRAATTSVRASRFLPKLIREAAARWETRIGESMSARTLLIIVLILLLIGALPTWPYSSGWGYYPSGGLGLILLVLIVLALF